MSLSSLVINHSHRYFEDLEKDLSIPKTELKKKNSKHMFFVFISFWKGEYKYKKHVFQNIVEHYNFLVYSILSLMGTNAGAFIA